MTEEARARRLLADRRAEVERLRDGLDPIEDEQSDLAALSSADQHPADTGTELSDRTAALALREHAEAELREIDDAERRLDAGTYGRCEICDQPVGDERLEAEPATRRCIVHAGPRGEAAVPGPEGSTPL
jgi:RNA polymerase-binding transcription factor DksA